MIDSALFPASAQFCYTRPAAPDLGNYERLHPLERALVAQAVDVRKAEFGDARWCAHQALAQLGANTEQPILRGERGMPLWPKGFVGSITHTTGLRAAVAAPSSAVLAVGLDVEPAQPLPDGICSTIARPGELRQLDRLRAGGLACADRLLFCAKEATYKAWFPLAHRFLDFDEAEIELRPDGTLSSYILARPTPVPLIGGRWRVRDGYLVVSAFLERG